MTGTVPTSVAAVSLTARQRLAVTALCVGCGTYTLVNALLFPVLPTLQSALRTTQADVTWVLTAYLLAASVCTPVVGRLGDRYGKKRMLVASLGTLALGSLLGATATTLPAMIVARAVQGVGGGVLPLSFGIAQDQLPQRAVSAAIGAMAGIGGIGGGLGVVLAGPIISALDYHWLFWIPLIPTAAAAVAAFIVLEETVRDRSGRLRWSAFGLLTTWLVALLLAVSEGSQWGWRSPAVIVSFGLAAIALPLWVGVELRSPTPLIDMRMMRLRAVWTNNAATLLVGTCMFGSLVFITDLAETSPAAGYGFGASVSQAGLMIIPQPIMAIVVPVLAGRAMSRVTAPALLVSGSVGIAASMTLAAFAHDARWQISLSMGLLGAGIGLVVVSQSHIAVTAVPAQQTGASAGMNANIRLIGGAIGGAVMAALVSAGKTAGGTPAESGYEYAFLTVGVLALLGAAAAVLVPAPSRARQPEPVSPVAAAGVPPGG